MTAARDALPQLLQKSSEQPEWLLAPAVLHAAFTYCAEILTLPSLAILTRADVLTVLVQLAAALRHGEQALATKTRPALKQAVAGMRLQEALQAAETQLAHHAQQIEEVRATLVPLEQREEALRLQEDEYKRLSSQLTELRRLEGLAQHAKALPRQVEELTHRLARYGQPEMTTWEQQLHEQAEALIVVSTEALGALEPRVRQALAEAERLENACAAAAARLHEAQARAQQATADLQKVNNELRPQLAADRRVADAVSPDQSPHSLLDQAERLLQQAETALQAALKSQAEAGRLPRLPLMEGRNASTAV